jgi:phosphotransferase system IIA component
LASNFTTINAQQQFSQPGGIENGTIFQSTDDSFSIRVPQGWVIQDINNTGPAFNDERAQGYGILAQLCPEEQQQTASPATASGGGSTNTISSVDISSCRGAQDVIHIIRYPDLDTRLFANNVTANSNVAATDSILTYHLQKLQEVGYRSMQIVNSTDVTSNLIHPQTNETITTAPGKFVEMTFSTNVTPNEISRGYFILTATNATAPSLGATKGYSVFYEGNSTTAAAEITTAAASLPPPQLVGQVFDSFELIVGPEVAEQAVEDGDDDDDNGGDDDDNGGDISCHPSYPDECIPPPPPNLNCDDVDATNFQVVGSDPHGFDGDNNGIGCEDGNGDDDDNGGDDDDNGGDDDDNGGDDDDNGGDDDDNGGDDDDNGDNENGDEGEGGGGGEGNPNEFDDCIVPPGMDPGDVGC